MKKAITTLLALNFVMICFAITAISGFVIACWMMNITGFLLLLFGFISGRIFCAFTGTALVGLGSIGLGSIQSVTGVFLFEFTYLLDATLFVGVGGLVMAWYTALRQRELSLRLYKPTRSFAFLIGLVILMGFNTSMAINSLVSDGLRACLYSMRTLIIAEAVLALLPVGFLWSQRYQPSRRAWLCGHFRAASLADRHLSWFTPYDRLVELLPSFRAMWSMPEQDRVHLEHVVQQSLSALKRLAQAGSQAAMVRLQALYELDEDGATEAWLTANAKNPDVLVSIATDERTAPAYRDRAWALLAALSPIPDPEPPDQR